VLQGLHPEVQKAVVATLPSGPGERNRRLFELARRLKALPHLADGDPLSLEEVVRRWHSLALSAIRTKGWEESWLDFLTAWARVQFPQGNGPLAVLFAEACRAPVPPAAERFDEPKVRQLVALCAALQQQAGSAPFFLACRSVADLLQVNHVQAWRWLMLLERTRVLQRAATGSRASKKANEYCYGGTRP
jgi:hypothetical protein